MAARGGGIDGPPLIHRQAPQVRQTVGGLVVGRIGVAVPNDDGRTTMATAPSRFTFRTASRVETYTQPSGPAASPYTPSSLLSRIFLRLGENGVRFPSGEIRVSPTASPPPSMNLEP
jgi:hypothetical protein